METTPLVSVITPSYNHAKYIQETIESVAKQTYKNIEHIVIDDGSTDNSAEVIKFLQGKYGFYFEQQENKGLAFTMNKLISKCKGKYVALIESDDVWILDKIEKQVDFLEKNPDIKVCGGNALLINEKSEMLSLDRQYLRGYIVYNFGDIMPAENWIFPLTVMMRREVYDMVGVFDKSLASVDIYTWLKITANNYPIVMLPNLFGFYRRHESNTSLDTIKLYNNMMKTIDKFKDHPLYQPAKRDAMAFFFPFLAINHKKIAVTMLPDVFQLERQIIRGLIYLIIPIFLYKFLYGEIPRL